MQSARPLSTHTNSRWYPYPDPQRNVWVPGELYLPPTAIQINSHAFALVSPPVLGVIIYEVLDTTEIVAEVAAALSLALYTSLSSALVLNTASLGAF
jgi:hypothetical protein